MINLRLVRQSKQEGFILITTLVLMIMLTVLAVTQVSLNTTQTQVARNSTTAEISFEKTEGALNEAINRMINHTYTSESFLNNTNGLYLFNQNDPPLWHEVDWDSSTSVINSFQGSTGLRASYIIEQLPSVVQPGQNMKSLTHVYRVTGRAIGEDGNSSVLLQSTIQIQQ